ARLVLAVAGLARRTVQRAAGLAGRGRRPRLGLGRLFRVLGGLRFLRSLRLGGGARRVLGFLLLARLALLLLFLAALEILFLAIHELARALVFGLARGELGRRDHGLRPGRRRRRDGRRGDLLGHGLDRRNHLGGRRFRRVAALEHALLAHLDLDRAALALVGRIGGADFRGLPAGQRDALLGLGGATVLPAQVVEQAGLVLLGELIAGFLRRDPCRRELLEERRGRHLEFACELLDRHLGHACLRCAAVVACCVVPASCMRVSAPRSWPRE